MKAKNTTSHRLARDPLPVVSALRVVGTVALLGLLSACGQQTDPASTVAKAPDHSAMAHTQITEQADPLASDDAIVGMQVEDFKLLDHTGAAQRLYYAEKAPAIVLMTQGNGCPIVRTSMPSMHKVSETYAALGVKFFLLNSNIQDNQSSISEEVAEFGYKLPVLVDEYQQVGESLNVTRTAEVFVIDPATQKVVYHGPIDDRVGYENQRKTASHEYLIDALDNVLAGEKVAVSSINAPGCLINFPQRGMKDEQAATSYHSTIARIL